MDKKLHSQITISKYILGLSRFKVFKTNFETVKTDVTIFTLLLCLYYR